MSLTSYRAAPSRVKTLAVCSNHMWPWEPLIKEYLRFDDKRRKLPHYALIEGNHGT